MDTIIDEFENSFISALKGLKKPSKVLLAVSGGADSMAMLCACKALLPTLYIPFSVITINHNIRPQEVSAKDSAFVLAFCKTNSIECIEKIVEEDFILKLAKERKKGLEEAARTVRYSLFEQRAKDIHASHIFLGHNKNDQLETLLQRFLQGSFYSQYGIAQERELFFRPLLHISRKEIEKYLFCKGITYCSDNTNNDNSYVRNNIRNTIIPFLNESFTGWETGVLSGAKKALIDADFFESQLKYDWDKENKYLLSFNVSHFLSLHQALRIRLLYKALIMLKVENRVSYNVIEKVSEGQTCETKELNFYIKKDKLYIKKLSSTGKNSCFFAIIEKECSLLLNCGTLVVSMAVDYKERESSCIQEAKVYFPFVVKIEKKILKIEQLSKSSRSGPVQVCFIRNNDE